MLVAIAVVSLSLCAIVFARYFAAKTRLTEKAIDQAIARRLHTIPLAAEVRDLRELNGVMRNLLIDFVESEDIKPQSSGVTLAPDERKRLHLMREERRREIYAEALMLLRQTDVLQDKSTVE